MDKAVVADAAGGPIRNVSDTALWVAMYRAYESERPDALFHDPWARRLAGERGQAIVDAMPRGRASGWAMVVRTAVMDELLGECIQRGCRTVLNLAAGLDTRVFRLELPPALRWIDADLPDLVAYRRQLMAGARARCDYEAVAIDLHDAAARAELFARAGAGGPVLVITEGLLAYLTEAQVAELARLLHVVSGMRWWLIDLASPQVLRMLQRSWGKRLAAAAPLQFAPAEGPAFFAPHGWREAVFRSSFGESLRLGRTMRGAWLWRLVMRLLPRRSRERFERSAGIVLLERDRTA